MKKKLFIKTGLGTLLCLILFFNLSSAQQVVSSAGQEFLGPNIILNYTFGETFVDNFNSVSLGFHQGIEPESCNIQIADSVISATCNTENGAAYISVSGGVPPYSYQWSTGDSLPNADSLAAGIYMVTVTDAAMCSNFKAVMISNTNAPAISIDSVKNVSCFGGDNGAIFINASGGATPYTYLWSNGATAQDISNLAMSPYEIIVTGANGCSSAQSIFVSQPNPVSLSVAVSNAACGSSNGSATVTVNGGTAPYTYLWSNGGNQASIVNLQSEIYLVTVTDNNGCAQISTAAVGNTGGPAVQVDSVIPAGCGGTGSIIVSVSGGTSPYTYSWANGITSQNLVNATAGNYGLIVTDSIGCSGAVSTTILSQDLIFDPICLITVDTSTGTNKLVWEKTYGAGIASYKIYKEQTIAGIYQFIGNVSFDNLSVFTDSVANPLIRSWRYKISAVDSCGNESALSPEHKTIHLTVNQGLGNTVNLSWDYYQGFSFGTYYIYRFKPVTGWILKDSIPANLTSWTDFFPPTPFGLRYFI